MSTNRREDQVLNSNVVHAQYKKSGGKMSDKICQQFSSISGEDERKRICKDGRILPPEGK